MKAINDQRWLDLLAAARAFRAEGTTLTSCSRGACQRVVERPDNSDPQARLYAALKALDHVEAALNPDRLDGRG